MAFKPGESGNLAGRPKGTRNQLCEDFLKDLHELWTTQGKAILNAVAADKPEAIVNAATKLMPKDVNHFHKLDEVKNILDDELDRRIAALRADVLGVESEAGALPDAPRAPTSH
jgi:hypothetical protein